jgi:hypothetical protein
MLRNRSLVMVLLVMVALTANATRAFARHESRAVRAADEAQMRELLANLAAASGQPAPEERTDADLMYEAMLRWNGEPPDSAAINRALEQSKRDAAKVKRATTEKVRRMFWKDPFSDSPQKLIPVRQEDRDLLAGYERKAEQSEAREPRDEVSRLRAELAAARAETATARAETARARRRAEKIMSQSEHQGCFAEASTNADARMRRRGGEGAKTQIALATTTRSESYQSPAPPPPAAASVPAHGMIVVPLEAPPPITAKIRRHGSR